MSKSKIILKGLVEAAAIHGGIYKGKVIRNSISSIIEGSISDRKKYLVLYSSIPSTFEDCIATTIYNEVIYIYSF